MCGGVRVCGEVCVCVVRCAVHVCVRCAVHGVRVCGEVCCTCVW